MYLKYISGISNTLFGRITLSSFVFACIKLYLLKNSTIGSRKSSYMLKLLWSIFSGKIKSYGPAQFFERSMECVHRTKTSFWPCINKEGQVTFFITSIFLNLSATKNFKDSTREPTVSRIDLKGEIKIRPPGFLFPAEYTLGPLPIDLPFQQSLLDNRKQLNCLLQLP